MRRSPAAMPVPRTRAPWVTPASTGRPAATGINASNGRASGAGSSIIVTTASGVGGNVTGTAGAGIVHVFGQGQLQHGHGRRRHGVPNAQTVQGGAPDVTARRQLDAGTGVVLVTAAPAATIIGTGTAGIRAQETGAGPGAGNNGIVINGTGNVSSTSGDGIIAASPSRGRATPPTSLITQSGTVGGSAAIGVNATSGSAPATSR